MRLRYDIKGGGNTQRKKMTNIIKKGLKKCIKTAERGKNEKEQLPTIGNRRFRA